jgi:hypothetical protein
LGGEWICPKLSPSHIPALRNCMEMRPYNVPVTPLIAD